MISRRNVLKLATAAALVPHAPHSPTPLLTGGWVDSPDARARFQQRKLWRASDVEGDIRGISKGKVIRLWKLWERVAGIPFSPHLQEIGDCTSQALALGLETQSAVTIAKGGKWKWQGKLSTEALYIASRIEVGKGEYGHDEGSNGAWIVEAAERFGVLPRDVYPEFNVKEYNPELAYRLADCPMRQPGQGVPDSLEPTMFEHRLLRGVLIDGGFEQAADFVAGGYPVLLCSSQGFRLTPDSMGFLLPSIMNWDHAMLLWGIDRRSKRESGSIENSWGAAWVNPGSSHKYGTPPGGFWVDRHIIDDMLSAGDSYALVEYHGPQVKDLDYSIL